MSLSDHIKKTKGKPFTAKQEPKGPLWKGPEEDGITFSLLSRFLVCRERFRVHAIEGLRPADGFNYRIEYGQMWHCCEEELARGGPPKWDNRSSSTAFFFPLRKYCQDLAMDYPMSREQIDHWMNVCAVQYPIYTDYWLKHKEVSERTPLLQEQVFDVPYKLPSGRTVRLRGKWDSVDLIGSKKSAGIYLQENKTKGDIKEEQLRRQLTFDLQTMMYLVAIYEGRYEKPLIEVIPKGSQILGVRYNVIRRPLSGGKGSIVRHKATKHKPEETKESFYSRLRDILFESPQDFFFRWRVEVSKADVEKFRRECLDPVLEQLCDWWEWVSFIRNHNPTNQEAVWDNDVTFGARPDDPKGGIHSSAIHWRHPFGVYNILDEGGSSDLDEYLSTGSEVGLERATTLFPELE
jgi:hypothetical protein